MINLCEKILLNYADKSMPFKGVDFANIVKP